MAEQKPNENVTPLTKQAEFETKDLPQSCMNAFSRYQMSFERAMLERNSFVEGVAMTLGLDNSWRFDIANGKPVFYREKKKEEKTETK